MVLQESGDEFNGAILDFHGEWMSSQGYARVVLVRLQGRLEKRPQTSGPRLVTHIASREEYGLKRWSWLVVRKRSRRPKKALVTVSDSAVGHVNMTPN